MGDVPERFYPFTPDGEYHDRTLIPGRLSEQVSVMEPGQQYCSGGDVINLEEFEPNEQVYKADMRPTVTDCYKKAVLESEDSIRLMRSNNRGPRGEFLTELDKIAFFGLECVFETSVNDPDAQTEQFVAAATAAPSLPENFYVAYAPWNMDEDENEQMWNEDNDYSMYVLRPAEHGQVHTIDALRGTEADAFWDRQGVSATDRFGLSEDVKLDRVIAILNNNKGTSFEVYPTDADGNELGTAVVYAV